jgi:hypothetical protein
MEENEKKLNCIPDLVSAFAEPSGKPGPKMDCQSSPMLEPKMAMSSYSQPCQSWDIGPLLKGMALGEEALSS